MNTRRHLFFWTVICSLALQTATAVADEVVLWNKLGSDYEVTHSEVGPNGTRVGSSYAFEVAQFGNGYVRKATGENYVIFPASLLNGLTRRGTIAVWINPKVSQPQPYEYGVFGLVGAPYGDIFLPSGRGANVQIVWGDGVTALGIVSCLVLEQAVCTPNEPVQLVATPGVPFHVAASWDIDGIDGTTDTLRTYRDGNLVGKATDTWNPSVTPTEDIVLGYGPDSLGYDKFITDNIVIWDYAKTEFSDRFNENPVGQTFSAIIPRAIFKMGAEDHDDTFRITAKFGLGAESDGIDPLSEAVGINFGSFAATIPAGSFERKGRLYSFTGTINMTDLDVLIHVPQTNSRNDIAPAGFTPADYWFKVKATNANLGGTVLPPKLQFTVGDDLGSATLNVGQAKFDKGKDGEEWLKGGD